MSITLVVGGQFGGEGKGKITSYLCKSHGFDVAVRCGGPNSGHTITFHDKPIILRQIPAGVINQNTRLFLAAGCLIDLGVLTNEIQMFNLNPSRLKIDRNSMILDQEDIKEEENIKLKERIGSTCKGVGSAVSKRVLRGENVRLAKDIPELKEYITDTADEVMFYYKNNKKIVIEGTQGFGLSLYHSPYYPYTTSRDTTASGFLSEAGISPMAVLDIIMVIRTFPIRVGGNSGPLPKEIHWEIIQRESGYPYKIQEYTTVTKRLRRVGRFDLEIVKKAVIANMPTQIALMGVDYLDYKNNVARHYTELTETTREFISWLEREFKKKIIFVGTGPTDYEIIDRSEEFKSEQQRTEERIIRTVSMS